jgi:taurine dioxygenase
LQANGRKSGIARLLAARKRGHQPEFSGAVEEESKKMVSLNVTALQDGLPFGARIKGVTREALGDEAIRRQIKDVFEDRGVIVFEEVEQTSKMQVMLSEAIGPLKDHPVKMVPRVDQDTMPGVITISADLNESIVEIDGKPLITWQPWHFDHTYNDELNLAGLLRAETIAPEGGMTAFADGIDIYNRMSPEIRAKAEGLNILYTLDMRYAIQKCGLPKNFREIQPKNDAILEYAKKFPRAIHPAVWTRKTGEKVMHMTPYGAKGIEGRENPEGDALFAEIWAEVEKSIRPYYHSWKITDMVLWDNSRVLHEACGCDPKYARVMHRTTIKGDYGLGRWETAPKTMEAAPSMA